jgi:hypothetical protein
MRDLVWLEDHQGRPLPHPAQDRVQ